MRVPKCQPFSCDLGKRYSNFQFRFSFTHAIGEGNLNFHFRFPFSYLIENGIRTFIFVFRFPWLWTTESLLPFPLFVFIACRKTEFELRSSFLVSMFSCFHYFRISALPVNEKVWAKLPERPGTCRKKKYMDYNLCVLVYCQHAVDQNGQQSSVSAKFCDKATKIKCPSLLNQYVTRLPINNNLNLSLTCYLSQSAIIRVYAFNTTSKKWYFQTCVSLR